MLHATKSQTKYLCAMTSCTDIWGFCGIDFDGYYFLEIDTF